MGKPMAMNLLKGGHKLIVSALRKDSFSEFEERGAQTTTNVADLAQADIIFLSLPNGEVVRNVLLGEKGFGDGLRPRQIVVDTSTITYSTTMEIAKALEARGVAFLDAPVSGMEARAIDGTLTVMCGGSRETFDTVKPYLKCMGNNILFMGDAGSGQLAKLINQLLFDMNTAALAEFIPMAAKMGLSSLPVRSPSRLTSLSGA